MFDPNGAPRLETERLILRAWRAEDFEPFATMMANADVARFLTTDQAPQDRAAAWRGMAMFVGHWALRGYGLFAVEERASRTFVGRVGGWRPEGWAGLELGWALTRAHWGKGFALEAARAAGDWLFAAHAPERLISLIHVGNAKSQALATRVGMTIAHHTYHAGMPYAVWAVAREDWQGAPRAR